MPAISVVAPDTSLAMQEVARRLGSDAYILATLEKDGQVEIKASSDPTDTLDNPDLIASKTFGGIIAARAGLRPKPTFKSSRIQVPEPGDAAEVNSELVALRQTLDKLIDYLETGAIAGAVAALDTGRDPTALKLAQTGFSPRLIAELRHSFEGMPRETGAAAFIATVAHRLVVDDPAQSLKARRIAIVGPSGGGRTLLAAKIAARLLLDIDGSVKPLLVGPKDDGFAACKRLQAIGRILNLTTDSPNAEDSLPLRANDRGPEIFDLPADPDLALTLLAELKRETPAADLQVILALPGGASSQLISRLHAIYGDFDPVVALTRLDTCDVAASEISTLAEAGLRLAWLTGTSDLTDALVPAKPEMLESYITQWLAPNVPTERAAAT